MEAASLEVWPRGLVERHRRLLTEEKRGSVNGFGVDGFGVNRDGVVDKGGVAGFNVNEGGVVGFGVDGSGIMDGGDCNECRR